MMTLQRCLLTQLWMGRLHSFILRRRSFIFKLESPLLYFRSIFTSPPETFSPSVADRPKAAAEWIPAEAEAEAEAEEVVGTAGAWISGWCEPK
jgi:hypothetical protein